MNVAGNVRLIVFPIVLMFAPLLQAQAQPAATPGETQQIIVFVRHGEKPGTEFGQLSCQGLNRALALPNVLVGKYGKPDFIFAPDPAKKIEKDGVEYSYARALATIEPTAIQLGLPVETRFGYKEIGPLQRELLSPRYKHSLIFVAWEHLKLYQLVKNMLSAFGKDSTDVPKWENDNYDSIFVIKIRSSGHGREIEFEHDHESLDGLSTDCPGPVRN